MAESSELGELKRELAELRDENARLKIQCIRQKDSIRALKEAAIIEHLAAFVVQLRMLYVSDDEQD